MEEVVKAFWLGAMIGSIGTAVIIVIADYVGSMIGKMAAIIVTNREKRKRSE